MICSEGNISHVHNMYTRKLSCVKLPEFIWLAAGSLNGLSFEKCKILEERKGVLYPDLDSFQKLQQKAKEFSDLANFRVSDLLELEACESERRNGLDLADNLIKLS